MVTEVFRNFPQSLQENAECHLNLGIYRFILFFCLIRYSFIIYAMQSEVLEAVLNKPRINKKGQSKAKKKAVPLHAMVALGGRGGIALTHS
jgi:hypothetical protein